MWIRAPGTATGGLPDCRRGIYQSQPSPHQVERALFPAFLSLFACRFSLALLEAGVLLLLPPLSLPAMAASPTFCCPLGTARP